MGAEIIRFPSHRMRPDREPLVKKRDIAEGLHVSMRWINYRMERDGFPFHKDAYSRLVYFKWSEVDEWLASRRTAP